MDGELMSVFICGNPVYNSKQHLKATSSKQQGCVASCFVLLLEMEVLDLSIVYLKQHVAMRCCFPSKQHHRDSLESRMLLWASF